MGVEFFTDVVCPSWVLEKEGSYAKVLESDPGSNNKEVLMGGCSLLAFSLDKSGGNPFPFIKSDATKKGMRSVCDAMVVAKYNDETYFIAMDMKSNQEGKAKKQIESARLLFNWLLNLAKIHGHWPHSDVNGKFVGIINLAPRNQVRKGLTRRSAEIPSPEISGFSDYPLFRLKNHPKINVPLLLDKL